MGHSVNQVLLRKMMKSFIILNILVSVYVGGQSSPWPTPNWEDGDCCQWKSVGGVKYKMVERSSQAWSYNCSSDCVYKNMDNDGDDTLYCFKPGALVSECHYEGGSKPPMTGGPTGSQPPMTGGPATGGPTGSPATGSPGACKCGVERTSRIVGGTEVNPKNKYPWMVALVTSSGGQFCGGTLVASKYVISAAHCMFEQDGSPTSKTDIKIRIGEHDFSSTGEGSLTEITIDVANYTNHESYSSATTDNDITIIELAQEVDLTAYTPACLAKTSDTTTFDGKNAWVYGWGTTSYGGSSSSVLLEVEVPVVTNDQCKTTMGSGITDGMICAGGVAGKDGCQGDSGGPLTYKSGTQHVLIGDVSFGDQCALAGKYGVYGRISFYRTWIEGKMSSPKYCGSGPDADA